jgi:hypothetical protein
MREYFAPESGRGLGARDFGWTAALCLRELGSRAGDLALAAGPASARCARACDLPGEWRT